MLGNALVLVIGISEVAMIDWLVVSEDEAMMQQTDALRHGDLSELTFIDQCAYRSRTCLYRPCRMLQR